MSRPRVADQTLVAPADSRPRFRPTYQVVKTHLVHGLGRQWAAGTRLPPLKQLASKLGAGERSTLRAVQELVNEGLLVSSPGRGTFVTGRPAPEGDALGITQGVGLGRGARVKLSAIAGQHLRLIGSTGANNEFHTRMSTGFRDVAEAAGAIITETSWEAIRGAYTTKGPLPKRRLDALSEAGLVLLNPYPLEDIEFGPRQIVAIVTTFSGLDGRLAVPHDFVSVEEEQGGFLAGQHLSQRGCTSACFLGVRAAGAGAGRGRAQYDAISRTRLSGFERGLGRTLPEECCLAVSFYDYTEAPRALPAFLALPQRPRAIFAASDELALGFVAGAIGHGLEPGRDYLITGFDGQDMGKRIAGGPLTSVAVPCEELGRAAAELMISRFEQPGRPVRRLLLGCSLNVGKTTDAAELRS